MATWAQGPGPWAQGPMGPGPGHSRVDWLLGTAAARARAYTPMGPWAQGPGPGPWAHVAMYFNKNEYIEIT